MALAVYFNHLHVALQMGIQIEPKQVQNLSVEALLSGKDIMGCATNWFQQHYLWIRVTQTKKHRSW